MKALVLLAITGSLTLGCSAIKMDVPLTEVEGWVQMISNSEVSGVPVLSVTW